MRWLNCEDVKSWLLNNNIDVSDHIREENQKMPLIFLLYFELKIEQKYSKNKIEIIWEK